MRTVIERGPAAKLIPPLRPYAELQDIFPLIEEQTTPAPLSAFNINSSRKLQMATTFPTSSQSRNKTRKAVSPQ